MKDFNFDNENIYNVNSDQTQNNQNFSSDQEKSEQSESDSEDYFADHVDILDLKTKICQFCQQNFAFNNLLHKHFLKKNCSKKSYLKICQFDKKHQFNKNYLID